MDMQAINPIAVSINNINTLSIYMTWLIYTLLPILCIPESTAASNKKAKNAMFPPLPKKEGNGLVFL